MSEDHKIRIEILKYIRDQSIKDPNRLLDPNAIANVFQLDAEIIREHVNYLILREWVVADRYSDDGKYWSVRIHKNGLEELEKIESKSNLHISDTDNFLEIEVPKDDFPWDMQVFISHSFVHRDKDLASSLKSILKRKKIFGYLAEKKKEYTLPIDEKIQKSIRESQFLIAVMTEDSLKSASVNQEIGFALGYGVPVAIMVEKGLVHEGVFTKGRDTEEFTRGNFPIHCENVIQHILDYAKENEKQSKTSDKDKDWLKQNVYPQLYNKMKKMHDDPDKFGKLPVDPWKELEPVAVLKCEDDIKNLFNEFSIELDKWKSLLSIVITNYSVNRNRLGEIVKTAFEKAGLIRRGDGHIILNANSSQEPQYWIDAFRFIIFDESITTEEILYKKLVNFARTSSNGHLAWIEEWKRERPILFTYLLLILPLLRKELKIDTTNELILQQQTLLNSIIEKIIKTLEVRI